MKRTMRTLLLFLWILQLYSLSWCAEMENNKEEKNLNKFAFNKVINVNFAAGLSNSVNQGIDEFRQIHPQAKFLRQSGGTLFLIKKIREFNQKTDLIFTADTLAIKKLTSEYANWYIQFGRDRIVLAYADKSKYSKEINNKNWFRILARKDVRYGYADLDLSALGYRTFLTWQLADMYYKTKINNQSIYDFLKGSTSLENILPDAQEVLNLLESGSLDYAFVYESGAQARNLKYVQLPKEIDLGSPEFTELYKKATVEVSFKNKTEKEIIHGMPITFGVTILQNASNPKGALEFIKFFLGPQGQTILRFNHQIITTPLLAYNIENVPKELLEFVTSEDISNKQ